MLRKSSRFNRVASLIVLYVNAYTYKIEIEDIKNSNNSKESYSIIYSIKIYYSIILYYYVVVLVKRL
jgi:hypothetical protein